MTKNPLNSKIVRKILISSLIFILISIVAQLCAPLTEHNPDAGQWYSIIPPLLAILLAFTTQHVVASLAIAIVAGGFLTCFQDSPTSIIDYFAGFKHTYDFVDKTISDVDNLQILAFIPPIFVMIELVVTSGGFRGIIRWLLRWVKGKTSAQMATALLGIICFIDDYTNAMIVGSAMRPVTDRFGVSREKLAFIVDATSAPITGLAAISTWIVYEVGLFTAVGQQLGIEQDGYSMFFDSLGFRFYCILMIIFVLLQILSKKEFGPMKKAEQNQPLLSSSADKPDIESDGSKELHPLCALIPFFGLIAFHITGIWVCGGGLEKMHNGGSLASFSYWRQILADVPNTTIILDFAALLGLSLALICIAFTKSLSLRSVSKCFYRGIRKSMIPCVILVLAWSLKNSTDSLSTGQFLATVLSGRISPWLFSPLLFFVASLISFSTGTSYGTMAILIPAAIPVAFALDGNSYGLTTIISLAAILDGAIFGDHCSPISDTTILSSISSQCKLIKHVRTQLPYSLFVGIIALLVGYLPAALGLSWIWSIAAATLIIIVVLLLLPKNPPKQTLI